MRVTIKKKYQKYKKGDVLTVTRDYGLQLITSGYATRQDKTANGPQLDPADIDDPETETEAPPTPPKKKRKTKPKK